MVTGPVRRPLIALTGRRLGETDRWPHSRALVSPRGYIESVERAGGLPALIDPVGDSHGILDNFDGLIVTGGPDLARVPDNLVEAIDALAGSKVAPDAFGADVHDHLLNTARQEWAHFNRAVTDWERRRNFDQW
jgi:hypothetical protein